MFFMRFGEDIFFETFYNGGFGQRVRGQNVAAPRHIRAPSPPPKKYGKEKKQRLLHPPPSPSVSKNILIIRLAAMLI